jgi:hypothetical protein
MTYFEKKLETKHYLNVIHALRKRITYVLLTEFYCCIQDFLSIFFIKYEYMMMAA